MTATIIKSVNLTQKRMICYCLTQYWKTFDDIHPGDVREREIKLKNRMMAEISEIRSRIHSAPSVKYQRVYSIVISMRDKTLINDALLYVYRKLNRDSDRMDVPKEKIKPMVQDMNLIELIYKRINHRLTKEQAENRLYDMWESGQLPSNFTPGHSEYSRAVNEMRKHGFVNWSDYFSTSN